MTHVSPRDLWSDLKDDGPTCDGCGTQHFANKNERGLRNYKGVDLCADCYTIPEVERNTLRMFIGLTMLDIQMRKTCCAICTAGLIDPQTGYTFADFKRVYIDVFDMQSPVWALVTNGSNWATVKAASDKCRNVCTRCHSAISTAKRKIGIQRLKTLDISDCCRRLASSKVESLVYMLVFQGADRNDSCTIHTV